MELKNNYKNVTGSEWKPGITPPPATSQSTSTPLATSGDADDISRKITLQGDKVRQLKSAKAEKVCAPIKCYAVQIYFLINNCFNVLNI